MSDISEKSAANRPDGNGFNPSNTTYNWWTRCQQLVSSDRSRRHLAAELELHAEECTLGGCVVQILAVLPDLKANRAPFGG